jgi:hypothetical protein
MRVMLISIENFESKKQCYLTGIDGLNSILLGNVLGSYLKDQEPLCQYPPAVFSMYLRPGT